MADSDSDGPPPLARSDSDSDGPPPLVDSSSDDANVGNQPVDSDDSPSESDGEDDINDLFAQMTQRAMLGTGWRNMMPNNAPLALRDRTRADEAAQKREAERKAAQEREEQRRREQRLKDEEHARKRAQLASLSEMYRRAKLSEDAALREKDEKQRIEFLMLCGDECADLVSKASELADTDETMSSDANITKYLALTLQAECLTSCAMLHSVIASEADVAVKLSQKAQALLASLPASLSKGLQERRRATKAKAHVSLGCAYLHLPDQGDAREEAKKAKACSTTVDLGRLRTLFEAEQNRQEKVVAENIIECNWGCGLSLQGLSKAEKHKHRNECPLQPLKCDMCEETGICRKDMETHKEESCLGRLEACHMCKQFIKKGMLNHHMEFECEERVRSCTRHESCSWKGPNSSLDFHLLRCPWNETQCEICFEAMYEFQLQTHKCPLVDGEDCCVICCDFLYTKPVAMLLKLTSTKSARACPHFNMHLDCAEKWRAAVLDRKRNEKVTAHLQQDSIGHCPTCREGYNAVSALADFLVVPPESATLAAVASITPKVEFAKATSSCKTPVAKAKASISPKANVAKAPVVSEARPKPQPSVAKQQSNSRTLKAKPRAAQKAESPTVSVGPSPFQPMARLPSTQAASSGARVSVPAVAPAFPVGGSTYPAVGSTSAAGPRLGAVMTWSVELEKRRPLPPPRARASPDNVPEWQYFRAHPSEIHFTQNSVKEWFRPFTDSKGKYHENKHILDTVREMASEEIPDELDFLPVVWYNHGEHSRWMVAGSYNRRLVVFRLLSIYFPDRFSRMKFQRQPFNSVRWTLPGGRTYLTTTCHGVYVEVLKQKYVGRNRKPDGADDKGVVWQYAETEIAKIRKAI